METFRRLAYRRRARAGVAIERANVSWTPPRARGRARRWASFVWSIPLACLRAAFESDAAKPPRRRRALVRVRAASVNPVDAKYLYGDKVCARAESAVRRAVEGIGVGFDFSGTVFAVEDESEFAVGASVFGMMTPGDGGAIGEFVSVYEDMMVEKPIGMSFREAAALPLCATTICQALDTFHTKISPSPALVVGASGGLGHLACQICKAEGAVVVGVCSMANLCFVRDLGVDLAVPYDDPDASLEVHLERAGYKNGFKLILDTVTSNASGDARFEYARRLHSFAAPDDCRYVKFGGKPEQWAYAHIKRLGIPLPWSNFDARAPPYWIYFYKVERQLLYICELYERGALKPIVARHFPFTDDGVRDAVTAVRSRHVAGKIIVDIVDDPESNANDAPPSMIELQ